MDPFAAISLASSVFTLIDLAIKTVKVIVKVAESPEGAFSEDIKLEAHAECLDVFCASIDDGVARLSAVRPCKEELNLLELSQHAIQLANELKDDLSVLKRRPGEKAPKRATKAVRTPHEARTVQEMNNELKHLSEGIHKGLLAALRQTKSAVMREILEKQSMHSKLQSRSRLALDDIKEDLIQLLTQMQLEHVADLEQNVHRIRVEEKRLREEEKRVTLEHNMLNFLAFDGMRDRRNRIANKHERTLGWFFDDYHENQSLAFAPWLKTGSGIFWISGHSLQRSCVGLLRALLFELLRQFPSTIEQLPADLCSEALSFNGRAWSSIKGRYDGNEDAFSEQLAVAITKASTGMRLCLFIDGLDECDGQKEELVKVLKRLAKSPDVKMCVSSRSWTDGDDKIVLHEHNMDDIRSYAKENLQSHAAFSRLAMHRSEYEATMETLVARAKGVFLWITLAVRSLESGRPGPDSMKALKLRVEKFPWNLEGFFQRMFESIEPLYHTTSARTLLILLYSRSSLPIFTFQSVSEIELSNGLVPDLYIESLDKAASYEADQNMMRHRVKTRCKDLVDLYDAGSDHNWVSRVHLGLLHRTVFDFLAHDEIQGILAARAGSQFHAPYWLGKYTVSVLRMYTVLHENHQKFKKTLAGYKIVSQEDGDDCSILVRRIAECCHTATIQAGELPEEVLSWAEGVLQGSYFDLLRRIAAKHSLSSHHIWAVRDLILIPSIEAGFLDYLKYKLKRNKSCNLPLAFMLDLAPVGHKEDTIKMMLQNGAKVNEDFEGLQFWEYYLSMMLQKFRAQTSGSARDAVRREEFTRIVILLVQHGANLSEYVHAGRGEAEVALDIVRKLCSDDDYQLILAHVREAQANRGWLRQLRRVVESLLRAIRSA